ncbi:MAG TPA: hypothetical protein VJ623_00235 [Holophagaceae bacterium]|nr:hypothetical protein [Holophagaceae bacterium]
MTHRLLLSCTTGLLLGLALACGGSSSAPTATTQKAATGLAYTDPTGAAGWRLVKDASSTPNRIVLNLVGPTGLRTRGVGFNLQAPSTVRFGRFANGTALGDTGVYQLLSVGSVDPSEPVALMGGVKAGNVLTAGIYQKDRGQTAPDSGAALCQIAIVFDASKGLGTGDTLALRVLKAKVIPEDIGTVTDDLLTLDKKLTMADITIAIGSLSAQ